MDGALPCYRAAVGALEVRSAVLDGEAVILDERGRSSFAELQADIGKHRSARAILYVFDLLFLDGEDLREKPARGAPGRSRGASPEAIRHPAQRGIRRRGR